MFGAVVSNKIGAFVLCYPFVKRGFGHLNGNNYFSPCVPIANLSRYSS